MKVCTKCGIEKPFAAFHYSKTLSRYASQCKECRYARNRANRTKLSEYQAKYNKENKDKIALKTAQYKSENRAKIRQILAKRRAAKKNATPGWANQEKIAEFYFAADFLGMVTGEWHQVDHVVPLIGKVGKEQVVCGLHWEGNLQVLTSAENLRKKNIYWPDGPML